VVAVEHQATVPFWPGAGEAYIQSDGLELLAVHIGTLGVPPAAICHLGATHRPFLALAEMPLAALRIAGSNADRR
jgi:hypothetical protein